MPTCPRHHRQKERRYVSAQYVNGQFISAGYHDVCPSCVAIAQSEASRTDDPPSGALDVFNTLASLDTSSTNITTDFSTPDTSSSTDTGSSFDFGGGGGFSGGGGDSSW